MKNYIFINLIFLYVFMLFGVESNVIFHSRHAASFVRFSFDVKEEKEEEKKMINLLHCEILRRSLRSRLLRA